MNGDLVTLAQAQEQCRVDADTSGTSPHDASLRLYIRAASRAVLAYLDGADFLDSNDDVPTDSNGAPIAPEDVQVATLFLVAEFFKNREATQDGAVDAQYGYGYLPRPAVALLYPHRRPVLS